MLESLNAMAPSGAEHSAEPPVPADVVMHMVLYYDVFRHPLAPGELARLCGGDPRDTVARLVVEGRLERHDGLVCRPGRGGCVEGRRSRARMAEQLWPAARRAGRVLAAFPWVRAALITGGMSKLSASLNGDVDFLLLIEPGKVWTAKTALQGFRRALPKRIRECFCTNYLLAADSLALDDRNMYTAMELATAVPVHGAALCAALVDANSWAARYVPGMRWSRQRAISAPTHARGAVARGIEALTGPRAEALSLASWDRYWNQKYAWLDADTRGQRFKRRPEIATNHLHDFRDYVLSEFHRRCDAAGVVPP